MNEIIKLIQAKKARTTKKIQSEKSNRFLMFMIIQKETTGQAVGADWLA